jgi:hypothetical protein
VRSFGPTKRLEMRAARSGSTLQIIAFAGLQQC